MEWGLPCRTSLWAKKSMFCFFSVLFYIAGGKWALNTTWADMSCFTGSCCCPGVCRLVNKRLNSLTIVLVEKSAETYGKKRIKEVESGHNDSCHVYNRPNITFKSPVLQPINFCHFYTLTQTKTFGVKLWIYFLIMAQSASWPWFKLSWYSVDCETISINSLISCFLSISKITTHLHVILYTHTCLWTFLERARFKAFQLLLLWDRTSGVELC